MKKAARITERPVIGSSEECSAENRQARYGCDISQGDARSQPIHLILVSLKNSAGAQERHTDQPGRTTDGR